YTDTLNGRNIYAVYNVSSTPLKVHFFGARDTTVTAPQGLTLFCGKQQRTVTTIEDEHEEITPDPLAWDLPYPNLALHKPVTASSEENAGCLAEYLTDGKTNTRWGSAHKDNEYVIVDLQQLCYIDHLILRWETAYASEYELSFSNDNSSWNTDTYSSAGGVEKVMTRVRARYIRLKGIQRATAYGTSLYELEAYGRPLTGDPSAVFVIALSATDTVLYQGQTTTLFTTAYGYDGKVLSTTPEQITFPQYGLFTETRTVEGCSASLTFVVMETEHASEAKVEPAEVTLPLGTEQTFVVSILNQFGTALETCVSTYRATQVGDFEQTFDCFEMTDTALIHVKAFDEVNLALNKPATASGAEGDNTNASKAVDGNMETRWSSRFQDNEWIAVDLEDCYLLKTVKLYWENAYATSFDIEVSSDGEQYTCVKSVSGAQGGVQTIDIRRDGQAVEAQFVRIVCKTRNTGYGSSLWELEVYGESTCDNPEQAIEIITHHPSAITNHKYIKDGQLFISHDGVVYTVSGLVFMR
ncbi:MAG: discoidin domain-containing protein, partial [Paludibacteraceae bacterium]|nr:discoidin domain-containing protein [Paludibacteraceae bacterium]